MIYGIGVDLVQIQRIEGAIERWGEKFINRVFTDGEIEICCSRAFPPSAFALRFAAKEAFSKAIGLGMKRGIRWRDIEVFHFPGGRPGLRLHGKSLYYCNQEKITDSHLSLSDEGDYGVATVILEKRDETG